MPPLFDLVPNPTHAAVHVKHAIEDPLVGTHKVVYSRAGDWDFEGGTDRAPVDLCLVMPPHRPKNQPQHHRMRMFVSSESGPVRVKVCRHCLNRAFSLEITAGTSDVTVWVPSNFAGFISFASGTGRADFSAGFANHILPNAYINAAVPKSWHGDEITISTAGSVTFRMWDVFAKAPEVPHKEVWRRVFKGTRPPSKPTLDWDFLLEDD